MDKNFQDWIKFIVELSVVFGTIAAMWWRMHTKLTLLTERSMNNAIAIKEQKAYVDVEITRLKESIEFRLSMQEECLTRNEKAIENLIKELQTNTLQLGILTEKINSIIKN